MGTKVTFLSTGTAGANVVATAGVAGGIAQVAKATGAVIYDTAYAAGSGMPTCIKVSQAAGTVAWVRSNTAEGITASLTPGTTVRRRTPDAAPSADEEMWGLMTAPQGFILGCYYTPNGSIYIKGLGSSKDYLWQTTADGGARGSVAPLSTWYEFYLSVLIATSSTGGMKAKHCAVGSTTAVGDEPTISTGRNFGTTAAGEVRVGELVSLTPGGVCAVGVYQFEDGMVSFAYPTAYSPPANVKPTATISGNQTVPVGGTPAAYTLGGTDSDGSIATRTVTVSRKWPSTATSPTIAVSGTTATVTPNGPGDFELQLINTDNLGLDSDPVTTHLFVPGLTGVPVKVTANTGGWYTYGGSNPGSTAEADIIAVLVDGSDTSGIRYPAGSTGRKAIRLRISPLLTPNSIAETWKRFINAASLVGVCDVRLYEGSTQRMIWTPSPSTSLATEVLGDTTTGGAIAPDSGSLATIISSDELDIEIGWTP